MKRQLLRLLAFVSFSLVWAALYFVLYTNELFPLVLTIGEEPTLDAGNRWVIRERGFDLVAYWGMLVISGCIVGLTTLVLVFVWGLVCDWIE